MYWLVACPASLAQQLNFYGLDVADGLSQSTIWSMAQTPDGNLWFATADGVDRYDGYSFQNYSINSSNESAKGSSSYFYLYVDQQAALWVSHRGGLHRFRPQKNDFEHVFTVEPAPNEMIHSIFSEDEKSLWVFINGGDIVKVNKATGKQTKRININPSNIRFYPFTNLRQQNSRFVYFNTNPGSYKYFDKKTERVVARQLPFVHPQEIPLALYDSSFLVLYKDKIYQTNLYTGEQKAFPTMLGKTFSTNSPPRLYLYKDWFISGTLEGLTLLDAQNFQVLGAITSFEKGQDESFSYVQSLFTDREQNLWVGTNGSGVYCYSVSRNRFPHYAHTNSKFNMTKALLGDNRGHMYVGVYKHGLFRYDLGSFRQPKQIAVKSNERGVVFLAAYSPDTLLYADFNAVYGLDTRTEKSFLIQTLVKINYITEMRPVLGAANAVDILSYHCIYRYAKNSLVLLYEDTAFMHAFAHLGRDSFLVGTDLGSLKIVHKGKSRVVAKQLGIIKNILIHNKRWYVASLSGLWVFDQTGKLLAHHHRGKDLPNNFLYGLLADEAGYIWMSHNAGLSRYHPPSKQFRHFTTDDGLQSSEFNTGSFTKTADGKLYFGGIRGFNELTPTTADRVLSPPASRILEVALNDQPLNTDSLLQLQQKMTLNYQENTLSFRFAAKGFAAPGLRQYAYRLQGYDANWIVNEKRNFVRYPNLPPGKYAFEARARYGDGQWGPPSEPIELYIAPPFWQRWWFLASAFVIGGLLVYYLVRRWLKAKEAAIRRDIELRQRLEQERQRISRDLHDNVGAQLTYLINNLDWLADRPGSDGLTDGDRLRSLSEAGRQAMLTLRQTIWAIGQEALSVDDFADRFKAYVLRMAAIYPGLDLHFEEKFEQPQHLSPATALHFFRIGQEAVHNILKHAQATRIEVFFGSNAEQHFVFTIKDNGCGFEAGEGSKLGHHGLVNMQSRAAECGASLSILSSPGAGSFVSLQLEKEIAWA